MITITNITVKGALGRTAINLTSAYNEIINSGKFAGTVRMAIERLWIFSSVGCLHNFLTMKEDT